MSERPVWTDVAPHASIEVFADFCHVNPASLQDPEIAALVLPNNRALTETSTSVHLFASQAKEVVDVLRRGGVHAALYRDDRDRRDLIRKSADIFLPILKFAGESAATIGLAILSSWLYDRFIKGAQKSGAVEFEYAILNRGAVIAWRRVEGDLHDVSELMAEESERFRKQAPTAQPKALSTRPAREPAISRHVSDALHQLDRANALLKEAGRSYRSKTTEGRRTAETLMRQSLGLIRQALLLDPNDKTRRYLHRVGLRIHSLFECTVEFDEGNYWVTCPVLLSHGRGGFSSPW